MYTCTLLLVLLVLMESALASKTRVPPDDYSVKCTDHAFWIVTAFNSSLVSSALPAGVVLGDVPAPWNSEIPPGYHPVIFELGHQQECHWKYLPILNLNFLELKYEIPFVKSLHNGYPRESKPIIYMDSEVNEYASQLVYGLPSVIAEMSFDTDKLVFTTNSSGNFLRSEFTTEFSWLSQNTSAQFAAFSSLNSFPWLCNPPLAGEECASNYYDWELMKIRPLKTKCSFSQGFFPGLPAASFTTDYPQLFLGASEVIVDLYISSPYTC